VLPRSLEKELLDGPLPGRESLRGNLRDLEWVNRYAGGGAVITWALSRLVNGLEQRRFRLLDVGTGGGDLPLAVVGWGRRRGLELTVDGLDLRPEVVELARERVREEPSVRIICGDALSLEERENSCDFVLCSDALHHFSPEECVTFLRSAYRIAGRALIVNDLRRCRAGWLLARLGAALIFRSREARHDGPLSVLRAYTADECAAFARSAGLPDFEVVHRPPFRLCLIARKQGSMERRGSPPALHAPDCRL
jgi:2-polyprenyl-3-methyl-5-hydroxy-6-metoxy-1,4-benzoquinol methylase